MNYKDHEDDKKIISKALSLYICTGDWKFLAHNRGRPCFSDVRIGNVFYSWPEMAKCFFYRIYHPYLAKSCIW